MFNTKYVLFISYRLCIQLYIYTSSIYTCVEVLFGGVYCLDRFFFLLRGGDRIQWRKYDFSEKKKTKKNLLISSCHRVPSPPPPLVTLWPPAPYHHKNLSRGNARTRASSVVSRDGKSRKKKTTKRTTKCNC